MRRVLIFSAWFVLTINLLLLSVILLIKIPLNPFFSNAKIISYSQIMPASDYQVYSSLPQTAETPLIKIEYTTAAADIIRQYLEKHHSPFAANYLDVLEASQIYSTEKVPDLWRYILAISQCESNLGKRIPENSYNAWGLGVFTGNKTGLSFRNWTEGIHASAKFLRKLIDKGLYTPHEWAKIYAPPSIHNGNSWANCVNHFLPSLQ